MDFSKCYASLHKTPTDILRYSQYQAPMLQNFKAILSLKNATKSMLNSVLIIAWEDLINNIS